MEFISTSQDPELAEEARKALEAFFEIIESQAKAQGFRGLCTIDAHFGGYRPTNWPHTPGKVDEYDVFLLSTALREPENLTGFVSISLNDQEVFYAKNGQILKDSLSLSYKAYQEQQIQNSPAMKLRQEEGKSLLKYASAMLVIYGQKASMDDNSVHYEGSKYIFREENGQIKVTNKENSSEVLNNSGFTEKATEEDIACLKGLKEEVQQFKLRNCFTPSRGLKP
jgi:hypothetical protein